MKIGIFTDLVDNKGQGSGIYVKNIVNQLFNISETHELTLIRKINSISSFYNNRKVIVLSPDPKEQTEQLSEFDLIHFSTLSHKSKYLDLPCKKVVTIFGGAEINLFPKSIRELRVWLRKRYLRPLMLKKMHGVVTISEDSMKLLIRKQGVPESNICLAYCGVGAEYTLRGKEGFLPLKEKFRINGRFIYHLSHYMSRKNPSGILNSFQILLDKYKFEGQLVISGKGWEAIASLPKIKDMVKRNQIIITGYVSVDDAVCFLNSAECFLFPSLYEGFGIPNLEAMACGCPVVSTDAYAISEVVGNAGLLVKNPHDADSIASLVHSILSRPELRFSISQRGLERVKLFNWTNSAKKILTFYNKLLSD